MEQEIIQPIDKELLKQELTPERQLRMTNKSNNEIYIVTAHEAPNVMKEIGRLREIAFREAGGGTGKSMDIDEFDTMPNSYKQLIVWNPEAEEIIGGYRYILGTDVDVDANGQPVLATSHMFHFSDKFMKEYMPQTIELGRSFVALPYQSSRMGAKSLFAHGLDNLYPPRHRETADRMVGCGGLLTEHFTNTNADKVNFVRRNRIVAGMSDATILVESAAKGGGLITCSLASSYNRDVFAFPGRIGDSLSEGCNKIIRNRSAQMVISAESFVSDMGWETDAQLATAQKNGIERSLFPEVEGDAKTIIDALAKNNDQQMNVLTVSTGLPINRLTALLFELEMKGMVKALAGGMYHLIS